MFPRYQTGFFSVFDVLNTKDIFKKLHTRCIYLTGLGLLTRSTDGTDGVARRSPPKGELSSTSLAILGEEWERRRTPPLLLLDPSSFNLVLCISCLTTIKPTSNCTNFALCKVCYLLNSRKIGPYGS